jgi:desampylase
MEPDSLATTVRLDSAAWLAIREHVRRDDGVEACGALTGHAGDGAVHLVEAVAVRNEAARPGSRFLISGAVVARLERRARTAGRTLLGFYHSHPRGGCAPSDRDRADAFPVFLYVIVDAVTHEAGAWRLRRDRSGFDPLPLEIGEAACP